MTAMDSPKIRIALWKVLVIRWALRQLRPLLPALYESTFVVTERFGIADICKSNLPGEFAVYLD